MIDKHAPAPAAVLRFTVPVGQHKAVSSGAMQHLQRSSLSRQLLLSLAARDVSTALHEADRFAGQAPADVAFDDLTPECAGELLDRSAVAMSLGDQVKRDVADEHAALAIIRGIDHGIRSGLITANSPLTKIDLTAARLLAKLGMAGGLDYLAGRGRHS